MGWQLNTHFFATWYLAVSCATMGRRDPRFAEAPWDNFAIPSCSIDKKICSKCEERWGASGEDMVHCEALIYIYRKFPNCLLLVPQQCDCRDVTRIAIPPNTTAFSRLLFREHLFPSHCTAGSLCFSKCKSSLQMGSLRSRPDGQFSPVTNCEWHLKSKQFYVSIPTILCLQK